MRGMGCWRSAKHWACNGVAAQALGNELSKVRLSRSGRYDMKQLKAAMLLLIANDAPLRADRETSVVGLLAFISN